MHFMGEREVRPGFNDHSEHVEITAQEDSIGRKTHQLFVNKLIRSPAWDIKGQQITILRPLDRNLIDGLHARPILGLPQPQTLRERVIVTTGLEKEEISPELARVIARFKMIEDKLPDFMRLALKGYRNLTGLHESSYQWGREELQHSLAAGLILEGTGHKTAEELLNDYQENLKTTWENPFPTPREVIIYSAIQERGTNVDYLLLVRRALEEGAPIVAQILELVARDEAYHGGGYRAFVKIFYEEDPEGTVKDVLHVASNFKMPIQNLIPDKVRALRDLSRIAGGLPAVKELIAEHTIFDSLMGFGFIPEKDARRIADLHR